MSLKNLFFVQNQYLLLQKQENQSEKPKSVFLNGPKLCVGKVLAQKIQGWTYYIESIEAEIGRKRNLFFQFFGMSSAN